jgi:hypothetical protein
MPEDCPRQLVARGLGFVVPVLAVLALLATSQGDVPRTAGPDPVIVPTFNCLGIYWSPNGGGSEKTCEVRYRPARSRQWKEALPLWFDARNGEYRGSIVNLIPDTSYEVTLRLSGGSRVVTARTWSESFPVGRTVHLPEHSDRTLVMDQSGAPDGYVVYTHPQGKASIIDVAGREEQCIVIKASYVIVRGLTLKGGGTHGIRIEDGSHDVVMEECDISGWGQVEPDGWGHDYDAAVFARGSEIKRVVLQRNRMHHPRSDSNSWAEWRDTKDDGGYHPEGAQAVTFCSTGGNHVIRYNEVYSDEDHRFNDCLGGEENFSYAGFPNRDSDIYGNRLSHCWDDAIESEGGNSNVRIWGNYIDNTFVKIAIAGTSVGPIYIWRNVAGTSRASPLGTTDEDDRGPFLKAGGHGEYNGGKIYVFHNTLLQPPPGPGQRLPLGCNIGLSSYGGPMLDLTSRNNILQIKNEASASVEDSRKSVTNDFDYDLYNGEVRAAGAQEAHGVKGVPVYEAGSGGGRGKSKPAGRVAGKLPTNGFRFWLAPSSPGYDAGVRLPNFNDGYTGVAPDMGAHEAGTAPMEFGVDAYRTGAMKARSR